MTRKALLVGAETGGLGGVVNDVTAMKNALQPRGFDVTALVTPHATRAAILNAYEKLIVDARPDDAFVIYYSGHGGLAQSPTGPDLQFIVPDDYVDSNDDDFRGITSVELSVLLARLTHVASNTTVILDCCHAAHMSRQLGMRVRSLLRPVPWRPTYETVEQHVDRLVKGGLPVHLRPLVSNPRAVRAVACASTQSAWEGVNQDGRSMGLFTDALARALREADGLQVNWSTLMDSVRRQVQLFMPEQRPEAEGSSERLPFETTDLTPLGSLSLVVEGSDRVELLGAPLLGVQLGDEFAILPAGAPDRRAGPVLGTATVDQLLPASASARLQLASDSTSIPLDARAHQTRAAAPAIPVGLPEGHPATAGLTRALSDQPLLRRADPGTDEHVVVEVVADPDGGLTVRDEVGDLHAPYSSTPSNIDTIVANLQRVAQATMLRRMQSDPARPLAHHVVVEWGRVRDGKEEPLPPSGALLFAHTGEHIYIRLRNDGDQPVFVSLLDIGVSYRIGLLTGSDPSGIRLLPGVPYTYGWNADLRQLTGVSMSWPSGAAETAARPETVLALISDQPVDVGGFRQRGARGRPAEPGLEQVLDQIVDGTPREVGPPPVSQVRYDIQKLDFMLSPTPPPAAERAAFLIDDRPELPIRLLSSRGTGSVRVAVRVDELIVHRNRALGNADVRVDAVVRTGSTADQSIYQAQTLRFSNIKDACRLPLDNALVYLGPAVDFLDFGIWVSRDPAGSLALGDLLERRLTDPTLLAATGHALEHGLAASQAAAAVTLISAGAVLMNTAYELLVGVTGRSIGLYRTSMLATERFGIGRHERHPQDFSFTFSVEEID